MSDKVEAVAKAVDWNELSHGMVKEVLSWLEAGKDFVAEQVPELVSEMLVFGAASHWVFVIVGVLMLGVAAIVGYRFARHCFRKSAAAAANARSHYSSESDWRIGGVFITIFSSLLAIGGVVVIFYNVYFIVMITYAPRWYLIKTFTKMISE